MAAMAYFRETGGGPGVVCLHANASSSTQWRALMELLSSGYHVLAADTYGAGKSPPWPTGREVALADEVELLEPVFEAAGDPHALVGHSYGAAVALVAAVTHPHRIGALALYEPTLFSVLERHAPPPNAADGIRAVVERCRAALAAGNPDAAAQAFIDYWMGEGSWARTPPARKAPIAASIANVLGWGRALMTDATPLAAFAELDVPVLYMMGKESPASSRAVGELLTATLPKVEVLEFAGLGHMGPVTHPDVVNAAILRFLERNT
jgi:pimeloyl-ACP methyl ester carboxylesterase